MACRNGAVHVATTKRTYKGKVYQTHLLRRSYRDGGKVKHQTLGNLSHLPRDLIETDRRGGCLLFGRGSPPNQAALGQLAGCLRRQGREAEARSPSARIRCRRPSIRVEPMADWAC